MSKRARKSSALVALLADVAPASGTVRTISFTSSEDRLLATDKAKAEATEALGVAASAHRQAEKLHARVGSSTTRILLDARQLELDTATAVFDAAWEAAFEALEAHDATGEACAA